MIRIAMLLLIAFGLAGFGVTVWLLLPNEPAPPVVAAAPSSKVAVLVVTQQLRPGLLLKPEDLTVKEIAEEKLSIGYVPDQPDAKRALIGGMVLRNLAPGDVLRLPFDVLRPADHGFLAAVLTAGTRAVTVAVDIVSGTAGLIWPGDRVDLILTQVLDEATQAPSHRVVAETVLRDVRVIAIDQQLAQGITGNVGDAPLARTVTLEVSAEHAEHVQVATRLGKLSLIIRSANSGPAVDTRSIGTYAGDVSHALVTQAQRPVSNTMKVYPGTGDGREFKF
jgi:pilus assembly protein CpaB